MGKYVNGTFVPDENDLLLQQQQKMAGYPNSESIEQENQQILAQNAAKAAAFQQAATQPAPVTPNPEVAQFAQAKANNQVNNSPRVAGQAGTVYNIFKQPAVEQTQKKTQTVATPVQQQPAPVQQTQNTQNTQVQQPITSTEDLARAMGYTSPEEEEKMRKASVANQRIMAVADALRQIGNIYNTVHYAPSQQFNSPVEMERQRYLQGKALRDKANQTYISYQQAKAAQDAKQRQWEAQFKYNMDKDARDYELKKSESEARNNLREAQLNRYQTLVELDQARKDGIISDNEYKKRRAELYPQLTQAKLQEITARVRVRAVEEAVEEAQSNMPDYEVVTENTLNDDGRIVSQKKTRTVKRGSQTSTSTKTTQKKKNPMGSSSSSATQKNKKKNPMS